MPDLEKSLQAFQANKAYNDFPSDENYYQLYVTAKEWLSSNALNKTGIKVACDGEGFYTDHSINHCNSIIKIANTCLDFVYNGRLSPYETYLFLISTLIHDAGMVYGRKNHGENCSKIGEDMPNLLPINTFERISIYKIASAHHGRTIFGSRDTLSTLAREHIINNVKFRPALIASLIRFFDEISEDYTRASGYLLNNNLLPDESIIHHAYAHSIRSVNYISNGIEIIYYLNKNDLEKKFPLIQDNNRNEIYIFDWICSRFAKINNERQYCASYMWGFLPIEHVTAKIQILDENFNDIKAITIKGADNFSLDNIGENNIVVDNDYNGEKLLKEVFPDEQ